MGGRGPVPHHQPGDQQWALGIPAGTVFPGYMGSNCCRSLRLGQFAMRGGEGFMGSLRDLAKGLAGFQAPGLYQGWFEAALP